MDKSGQVRDDNPMWKLSLLAALTASWALGCSSDEGAVAPPDVPAADADVTVEPDAPTPDANAPDTPEAGVDAPPETGPDADAGPTGWPFALEREPVGEPLTDAEITAFTKAITGLWKDVGFFRWVTWHSHGMHASNPDGMPDYAVWWQDTQAIKEGDTIAFAHGGGADNIMIRTSKVLASAIPGYLASGDPVLGWIVEQYCKGIAAVAMGMEFGPDDPAKYVMARAIFTQNHSYTTDDGRKVRIDYDPIKDAGEKYDWNAATIPNPDNPYWGSIWVRQQRSKDDVPHLFRTVPMVARAAAEAPDEDVRAAAALALEYLEGFARDIVDHGYQIRSKFKDGVAVVPTNEDGTVKDLASFVLFDGFIPDAECNPKLAARLIAYGETGDLDCGLGGGPAPGDEPDSSTFEEMATTTHYFNYAIYRYFHLAAITNALVSGQDDAARELLVGLIARADRVLHDETMPNRDAAEWLPDGAGFLIAAAASGLPLTAEEARVIVEQVTLSTEHYRAFPYWDPWDASVPDGPFDYKPDRRDPACPECPWALRAPEMTYLLEYCGSPWRHPDGARLVDCDVVLDPTRWGQ